MAHHHIVDLEHARHLVERLGAALEDEQVIHAFRLLRDLVREAPAAPCVVAAPGAAALLDETAHTRDQVVLVGLGALRVQHQKNLVRRQSPDDLLPSHGLNRPRLLAPLGTERRDDGAGSSGHCSIGRMKRLYAWLAGVAGGMAAYRLFRRRPQPRPRREPVPEDPAAELKAKLAEARAAGDDREEFEAGETPR